MPDLGAIAGDGTVGTTGGGTPSGGSSSIDEALFVVLIGANDVLDTSLAIDPQTPTFTFRPTSCRQTNFYRVKTLSFGESYEQRQADGLNAERLGYDLSFDNVDQEEGDAIEAFISERGGVESFQWTPPGKSQGTYVCTEPITREWDPDVEGNSSITCKFRQVFEL